MNVDLKMLPLLWHLGSHLYHLPSKIQTLWECKSMEVVSPYAARKDQIICIEYLFSVLTLWFPGEGGPGNPEFGCEVSKAWPRIFPTRNWTHVLLNDSSSGELINHLSPMPWFKLHWISAERGRIYKLIDIK
jgi:hypothetical protein